MDDGDGDNPRSMSLVPYTAGGEIVLRHGSSVVVFDQNSKQLSLRDASHSTAIEATSCPYCHRPYRDTSTHDADDSNSHEHGPPHATDPSFVNPSYFQMLHRSRPPSTSPSRASSPHKQLAPAPLRAPSASPSSAFPPEQQYTSTQPSPAPSGHRHSGISSRAFSPNYFKTFFVEERELGRGGKGVVLLVRHVLDGVNLGLFACKRVPVGDDHEWLEKVLIEVQLLQNLSHQNLVSYRHVWLEDYQVTSFGPSVPCAFILQQYCNAGDLQHHVLEGLKISSPTKEELKERMRRRSKGQLDDPSEGEPRRLPFEEIITFFKDITSGLNHLHTNGYIHRDLKPSNCLLHRTGPKLRVLVSDFGEVQSANQVRKSTGATGTISYCAPEVLRHESPGGPLGNFTEKSDIFSLGMIVYFMCFARLPYMYADGIDEEKEDLDRLRVEISEWAGFDDERRVRSDLPDKLYRSLKRLLALRPEDRPDTDAILQALKSPSALDELNEFGGPNGIDGMGMGMGVSMGGGVGMNMGPRISRIDTPEPSPLRKRGGSAAQGPGAGAGHSHARSKLHASVSDRSPSPVQHRNSLPSASTTARQTTPTGANGSGNGSLMLRPHKIDLPPPRELRTDEDDISPGQLMLPPPTQRRRPFGDLLGNTLVLCALKIALFGVKVWSLLGPCEPYAAKVGVAVLVMCFAALDFVRLPVGVGTYRRWGTGVRFGYGEVVKSGVLLLLHMLIVGMAVRWDRLCARRLVWEDGPQGL